MDRELHKFEKLPSLKLKRNSSSINTDSDIDDDPRYTSLKDIILNSPPYYVNNYEGSSNDFGSSSVSIRNQLVKHAASAYVQSAAIIASRNQNCFVRVWNKVKNKAALRSCWYVYIRNPLRACSRPICRIFARIGHSIGNVCSRRIEIV